MPAVVAPHFNAFLGALVPLRVAETVLRLREDTPLAVLPGIGHCPHDESPEAFHGVLIPWLQSLQSDKAGAGT